MRPLGLVVVPKRSMGSLDALLPVLALLKPKGIPLSTIVINRDVERMLESSAFHSESFRALSSFTLLKAPAALGSLGRIWKFLQLVAALVVMRLKCRKLVFLAQMSFDDPRNRALLRLMNVFGQTFWFPGYTIGETTEFAKRFSDSAWQVALKAGVKKRHHPVQIVHRAICYREEEIELKRARFGAKTEFSAIGNPRFRPEWEAYLRSEGPRFVENEVRRLMPGASMTNIVTIVVPTPEYFWFDDVDGCYRLINEIIDGVENIFVNPTILIKTKPQHVRLYEGKLNLNERNARLTTLGLPVLATQSRLAFGIQETSGIIDFLGMGVPVIEYGQYSSEWLKICPTGSAYRHYPGVTHVSNRAELESAVSRAKEGSLPRSNLRELRDFLGDNCSLDSWLSSLSKPAKPHLAEPSAVNA